MKYFWWYLSAGVVCFGCGAAVPGAWLMLQPSGFEAGELTGVVLLLGAAYVSLRVVRVGAWMAVAGAAAVVAFMVHRVVGAGEARWLTELVAAPAVALCAVVVWLAVGALRSEPVQGEVRAWKHFPVWPAVVVALLLAWLWPWRGRRDPSRYLVPESYVGWVVIEYNVAGAEPLPIRNGARECAIPASGRLRTSSKQEYGFALDDWEQVNAAGVRSKMPDLDTPGGRAWRWSAGTLEVPGQAEVHREQFFVGTEDQLKTLGEKTYPDLP